MTPQIIRLVETTPVLRVSTHMYGVAQEIDGKMFIFRVNLGMWPLKSIVSEKQALFWGFQHTCMLAILKEIDGKTFNFRVNLSMWPLKLIVSWKNKPCSEGYNTHLWCCTGDRWENIHFQSKPRHVTPQIDRLGKTSPVLRVPTHMYAVSKEIDGKMLIFRVNLGMWPLKSIVL